MGGEVRKFKRRAERERIKSEKKASKDLVQHQQQTALQKTKVFVSIPTLSGNVHWSIAQQFGRAAQNNLDPRCPYFFLTHIVAGIRPIEYARNVITEAFLHETDAEWLVMVDEDQIMPDNWWQLTTVSDSDIVSGVTFCWVGNGYKEGRLRMNQYSLKVTDHGTANEKAEIFNITPPQTNGQPYEVPIVGTGCIAIRRKVFNKIGCAPWHFTRYWNGKFRGAEDINFCVDARKAGFKIAVHPGVVFGHVKSLDLLQVSEYVAAKIAMEKEGRKHRVDDMLSLG